MLGLLLENKMDFSCRESEGSSLTRAKRFLRFPETFLTTMMNKIKSYNYELKIKIYPHKNKCKNNIYLKRENN